VIEMPRRKQKASSLLTYYVELAANFVKVLLAGKLLFAGT
jgi:hypothetical protein